MTPNPAPKSEKWADNGYRVLVLSLIGQAIQDRRSVPARDSLSMRADGGSLKSLDYFLKECAPKILAILGYKISGDFIARRAAEKGMIWKAPGITDVDPIATYRGVS